VHGSLTRPSMVSIGTIVWLSSELMFFAALFAMYFTLRSVAGPDAWPPVDDPAHPVELRIGFATVTTTVLVLSSFTCQLGVFAAERGDVYRLRLWFVITLFMGAFFVGGQLFEYNANKFAIDSHSYGSAYYITTGFHGLHVTGGLVAFLVVLARSTFGKFTPEKATSAIVVSYYWHFVDVVWIGLFAAIYLVK